ncbi:hypothetical protein EII34_13410 [Arachnia propionica]|uniref:Uncharacterized protein n=1 Tax=Arachnia propionica TaxID=1750 RepID=A0A3P1T2A7_9ACTN|nr:hypothetical protein [Arachnia propionica]RRD03581.1 hypothetical protein EII34_13410 [Arachnia propionica]
MLILPLSFALWIADWVRTARQLGTTVSRWSSLIAELSSRQSARLFRFVLLQALLAALVYSGFRLGHAMGISDPTGRNIADGKSFTWQELWIMVTTYSTNAALPLQAFYGVAGWLIALNLAHLARSQLLIRILTLPVVVIIALCALAGIGIGVIGLMVLSLATWLHHPGYNVGMVSLYAAWVVILIGIAVTLPACITDAEHVYQQ